MEVNQPIFIIGTGRNGSTALHKLLAAHPQVAWLSDFCNRYPDKPQVNRWLMQALDIPVLAPLLIPRLEPGENYLFWQHYARGFRQPCRDLTAQDVTPREKEALRRVMAEVLTRRRGRLLAKITDWPRLGYLAEIFPDAKFIHLVRDGRAVANSMLGVDFWNGWGGPSKWRWGPLTDTHQADWEASGRSFVALAGIEWVMMLDAFQTAQEFIDPANLLQVRYEDICTDKTGWLERLVDFAGLDWPSAFERMVGGYAFENMNTKWQSDLTPDQQALLEKVTRSHLDQYGYHP